MIDTNPHRRWRAPTGPLGRIHARAARLGAGGAGRGAGFRGWRRRDEGHSRLGLAAEEGVSLIEVMVSALMVGFIVIATFNGFNAVNHTTADERTHDQAIQLAAQSLEELRSDSAATLDPIEKIKGVGTRPRLHADDGRREVHDHPERPNGSPTTTRTRLQRLQQRTLQARPATTCGSPRGELAAARNRETATAEAVQHHHPPRRLGLGSRRRSTAAPPSSRSPA